MALTEGGARGKLARAALSADTDLHVPALADVERVWTLRENLTSYDAAYVALAEALGIALVTTDGRAARAPGIECDVQVLTF